MERVCGRADVETDDHRLEHHRDLDQSQSAMTQMGEYEPTLFRSVSYFI